MYGSTNSHYRRLNVLVLYSSCHFAPVPEHLRTNNDLIERVRSGQLKGLGIADVGCEYHIVEHDGKETVYLGKAPTKADVIIESEPRDLTDYGKINEALK